MQQLLAGTQTIAVSLPVGDWSSIAETAAKMKETYVLEKQLTQAQREEIERLPERFMALDEDFHARADKLRQAAISHDTQAVSSQFGALLNACVTCHSSFARSRFPGLPQVASSKKSK
jgi:cytochrome c556